MGMWPTLLGTLPPLARFALIVTFEPVFNIVTP
jgi:hypothetical protein